MKKSEAAWYEMAFVSTEDFKTLPQNVRGVPTTYTIDDNTGELKVWPRIANSGTAVAFGWRVI